MPPAEPTEALADPKPHGGPQSTRQWCLDVAAVNAKMHAVSGQPNFHRAAQTALRLAELDDADLYRVLNAGS